MNILKAEGLEAVFARHAMLATAMREGVKAAGLSIFPQERPSDALTAISAPEGVDGQAVYKEFADSIRDDGGRWSGSPEG